MLKRIFWLNFTYVGRIAVILAEVSPLVVAIYVSKFARTGHHAKAVLGAIGIYQLKKSRQNRYLSILLE